MQSKFYKNIINRLYDFKETESRDFQPFCCLKLSILLKTRKNGFAKCFFCEDIQFPKSILILSAQLCTRTSILTGQK